MLHRVPCTGTVVYAWLGRDAPYFQLLQSGMDARQARERAADMNQRYFPSQSAYEGLRTAGAR